MRLLSSNEYSLVRFKLIDTSDCHPRCQEKGKLKEKRKNGTKKKQIQNVETKET
jgi:hypothetical protein